MQKLCPQCQGIFPNQFLCPKCGIELAAMRQQSTVMVAGYGEEGSPPQAGMATRFIAGCLLAQGIYFGLKLIGAGFFVLTGQGGWDSGVGQIIHPLLPLVAALAGGTLAGAGNPRGLAAGAAVGLVQAMALIAAGFAFGGQPEKVVLYGGWIVLPLVGALGGRYGRFVWPPLSDVFDLAPTTTIRAFAGGSRSDTGPRRPTAWFRVFLGTALAVAGTVWAARVRDFIIGTSGGAFIADSHMQIQFIAWVISALALILGGLVAGAATGAGLRHGLIVGMLACSGIFVLYMHVIKDGLPAEQFVASVIGLDEDAANSPARIGLFLLTNSLALSIFGGWFGATLLPRTVPIDPLARLDRGAI